MSAAPIPQGELSRGYTVERHAREMVEGHYPKHREYLVAAAYLEQAAALAASEARVAELSEQVCTVTGWCAAANERAEAAEQSLAEARKDAERYRAYRASTVRPVLFGDDGWSEADTDAAIDALLPKGEG